MKGKYLVKEKSKFCKILIKFSCLNNVISTSESGNEKTIKYYLNSADGNIELRRILQIQLAELVTLCTRIPMMSKKLIQRNVIQIRLAELSN